MRARVYSTEYLPSCGKFLLNGGVLRYPGLYSRTMCGLENRYENRVRARPLAGRIHEGEVGRLSQS